MRIYHNPGCSKSCEALKLLKKQGADPTVIEYLTEPPTEQDLRFILARLNVRAHDIVRTGEPEYETLGLALDTHDDAIIAAILEHPNLLQRPIVVTCDKAVIGRPPVKVLDII